MVYRLKHGDALVILGLWVWLTLAVGPWWVGLALLVLGWIVNHLTRKKAV